MNNPAGKELYNLYKCHKAPKIHYPKPKQMQKKETQQEKKKCPQQTQIDYPEASQKPKPETHMIDIVPRRKKEEVIRKEIEDYYRKVDVPKNRGVDRKKMINDLQ